MSLSITLYQGCKLNNKYHEVFRSKTSLDTYLSGLTYLQVYSGDEIYYTNSGTISIDNSNLTSFTADKYNYMVFNETAGTKRYCFINSIQLVNSVAIVTYEEDIWHNYGITSSTFNFNMKDSLISQTIKMTAYGIYSQAFFDALPKKLPIELEGQNRPKFRVRTPIPDNDEEVYVLLTASVYTLSAQGQVNGRIINNYLLTHQLHTTDSAVPISSSERYIWDIDNQLTQILSDIYAMSSDTQITYQGDNNWHYEILNVKLIPYSIGYDWFNDILSADETHDDGLYSDFSLSGYEYGYQTGTPNPKLPKYQFNATWRFRNINLREENAYEYNTGDEVRVGYYYYNGFSDTQVIKSEKTIEADYKYIGIANASRFIKLNYDGHTKKLEYHLVINQFGNSVQLYFGNEIVDISSDFELHVPISVQSADVTQQQRIALNSSNLTQLIGITMGTINLGASIGQMIGTKGGSAGGDEVGAFSKMMNDSGKIMTQGIQLDAMNQAQFVTNHATNSYDVTLFNCFLGGLRELEMEYTNSTLLTSMLSLYGYMYAYITDSIECVYTQDNFVKFATANVYGNFSQEIARGIETILENGTRFL